MTEVRTYFSGLLRRIAEELDLSPSKREDVEAKYQAVVDWLGQPETALAPYDPNIYPHGSFRLGTVVRPLDRDEFDLDFVCRLNIKATSDNQDAVKQLVGDRLKENGTYRTNRMIREKNRCWRLNYAGDFHMDIMPSVPDPRRKDEAILVSDKELASWKASHPRGFAGWFDECMISVRAQLRKEARATVEELPDRRIKTPLQVAIQILKRHRDIHFKSDVKLRPSSIILTTLAAKAYNQQADVLETLRAIVRGMPGEIDYDTNGWPVVPNPTNAEENFSEKWREYPERFTAFKAWLIQVSSDFDELTELTGLHRIGDFLSGKLGQREVNAALRAEGESTNRAHQSGRLNSASTGGIIIVSRSADAARPVRRSTSYGGRK